jgi:hypothetical protein
MLHCGDKNLETELAPRDNVFSCCDELILHDKLAILLVWLSGVEMIEVCDVTTIIKPLQDGVTDS